MSKTRTPKINAASVVIFVFIAIPFQTTRTVEHVLGFKLLSDRQCANAFAGRGEDGVDQSWSKRRHAGFPNSAGWRIGIEGYDVHIGHEGSLVDPDHREVVKIALLYLAILEGDLAIFGKA